MDNLTVNFDLMRTRIELLFRLLGKLSGRDWQMPIQASNRLTSIIVGEGLSVIFIYRFEDYIDLTDEGKKNTNLFAEIVVRHFNNIRHRMMQPAPSMTEQIGNLEIYIREGIDTMMIELKAFFERIEKKKIKKFIIEQEVDFEISAGGKTEFVRGMIEAIGEGDMYHVRAFNLMLHENIHASKIETIEEVNRV